MFVRRALLLMALLILLSCVSACSAGTPDHVFLISVDGLRADLLDRAPTPNLDMMVRTGARALAARTVRPAVTLPAHASMLSGLTPKKHGVTFNRHTPSAGKMKAPNLLGLVAEHGRRAVAFVGKRKLLQLVPEVEGVRTEHSGYRDPRVIDAFVEGLEAGAEAPAFTFLHLPDVDAAGHEHGWGSPQQLEAVAAADAQVGRVFRAVHAAGLLRRSTFLVTADHGGHGKAHGTNHPREYQIEWLAAGVGIRPRARIEAPVSLLDVVPTVLALLDLPAPADLDGRVVSEALFHQDPQRAAGGPSGTQLGSSRDPSRAAPLEVALDQAAARDAEQVAAARMADPEAWASSPPPVAEVARVASPAALEAPAGRAAVHHHDHDHDHHHPVHFPHQVEEFRISPQVGTARFPEGDVEPDGGLLPPFGRVAELWGAASL